MHGKVARFVVHPDGSIGDVEIPTKAAIALLVETVRAPSLHQPLHRHVTPYRRRRQHFAGHHGKRRGSAHPKGSQPR
ncbi:MAG: hypothetical protein LBU62_00765 [Bacteroidales bacterium]|nr:hypothetical protein [Bacteroidales bacterium]